MEKKEYPFCHTKIILKFLESLREKGKEEMGFILTNIILAVAEVCIGELHEDFVLSSTIINYYNCT